jgi:hypothetical protein
MEAVLDWLDHRSHKGEQAKKNNCMINEVQEQKKSSPKTKTERKSKTVPICPTTLYPE